MPSPSMPNLSCEPPVGCSAEDVSAEERWELLDSDQQRQVESAWKRVAGRYADDAMEMGDEIVRGYGGMLPPTLRMMGEDWLKFRDEKADEAFSSNEVKK